VPSRCGLAIGRSGDFSLKDDSCAPLDADHLAVCSSKLRAGGRGAGSSSLSDAAVALSPTDPRTDSAARLRAPDSVPLTCEAAPLRRTSLRVSLGLRDALPRRIEAVQWVRVVRRERREQCDGTRALSGARYSLSAAELLNGRRVRLGHECELGRGGTVGPAAWLGILVRRAENGMRRGRHVGAAARRCGHLASL
jgi:hypothetical protein